MNFRKVNYTLLVSGTFPVKGVYGAEILTQASRQNRAENLGHQVEGVVFVTDFGTTEVVPFPVVSRSRCARLDGSETRPYVGRD